jgi:hypothetical protein
METGRPSGGPRIVSAIEGRPIRRAEIIRF